LPELAVGPVPLVPILTPAPPNHVQIACPRCHARAELPASKEGAKVRCSECGRVYVAHPPGRARSGGLGGGTIAAFAVAGAAVVVIGLWSLTRDGTPAKAAGDFAEIPAPKPAGPALDDIGWNSPAVRTAVRLHEAAYAYDTNAVSALLHPARIWEREQAAESSASPTAFGALSQHDRVQLVNRWVEGLVRGEGRALVGEWRPYDGEVVAIDDGEATVRLAVSPQDDPGSVEKRWVEWRLALDDGRWKAWSWERWYSPEELDAARRARGRGYEKVTLSDGSLVHEREPEPLDHLDDTPPALRARIDELYATMLDLDLTKEAAAAQHELVEIGRPAIPILLTGLYETPLDSEENAIKCNLIVQSLRRITGESFGYKPQVQEGSGVGTTEERRQSSIKQWFAWWYKNQNKFTEKQVEDGLEGLIELSEKEKRWLERNPD